MMEELSVNEISVLLLLKIRQGERDILSHASPALDSLRRRGLVVGHSLTDKGEDVVREFDDLAPPKKTRESIEGVVVFHRGEGSSHDFLREIVVPQTPSIFVGRHIESVRDFITESLHTIPDIEGKRVRVTVEVVGAHSGDSNT